MASFSIRTRHITAAPRAHLFTRFLSTSRPRFAGPAFGPLGRGGPSPPRLPKEEQETFEELQRRSTGAFSTPRHPPPHINQSPDRSAADVATAPQSEIQRRAGKMEEERQQENESPPSRFMDEYNKIVEARGQGEELHPNVRRGPAPEFEGDVNPKTGEVGGPKNEPLRWGPAGEWSYNGRTTDF